MECYDELAYSYDGSLEGLLTAMFEAYARKEDPADVWRADLGEPRLLQTVIPIETDIEKASRVHDSIRKRFGARSMTAIKRASLACDPHAATAAYRFVRYAYDEHSGRNRPLSNLSHPSVEPILRISRSVANECEYMRQFARFEHVAGSGADFWFARISPKHSVVPLIMPHFIDRFSIQAFLVYDEANGICGTYDGSGYTLALIDDKDSFEELIPSRTEDEMAMQRAWTEFYKAVSVNERYAPEHRMKQMPKRFWSHITEMQ